MCRVPENQQTCDGGRPVWPDYKSSPSKYTQLLQAITTAQLRHPRKKTTREHDQAALGSKCAEKNVVWSNTPVPSGIRRSNNLFPSLGGQAPSSIVDQLRRLGPRSLVDHVFGHLFDHLFGHVGRLFDLLFGHLFDHLFDRLFDHVFDRLFDRLYTKILAE